MTPPLEQAEVGLSGGGAPDFIVSREPSVLSHGSSRLADYADLAKVRLSLLVLLVTAAGFCLGGQAGVNLVALVHVILGTAMVAVAASAVNQVVERDFDRLMRRTANRPIPSGRMPAAEALAFGVASAAAGLAYLAVFTNLLAASLAGLTLVLYIAVYTPLKRYTVLNTLVGAVPGAIPPLIGYAAAREALDPMAWALFAILFFWQLPHFFAIAWIYREDYARGGYKMLSAVDATGRAIGRQAFWFSLLLLAASLVPTVIGAAGVAHLIGALVLGLGMLALCGRFAAARSRANARTVLLASIIYLPLLMTLMLLEGVAG